MTAKELIERLRACPEDLEVYMDQNDGEYPAKEVGQLTLYHDYVFNQRIWHNMGGGKIHLEFREKERKDILFLT